MRQHNTCAIRLMCGRRVASYPAARGESSRPQHGHTAAPSGPGPGAGAACAASIRAIRSRERRAVIYLLIPASTAGRCLAT